MDLISLKKYIYTEDKVEIILSDLGCHTIKKHRKPNCEYLTCANPDGDNTSAINIYLTEFLNTVNHTRNIMTPKDEHCDLLTLVTFLKKRNNPKHKLRDTIRYLHTLLGLKYDNNYKKNKKVDDNKPHPLDVFRKIKRRRKCDVRELEVKGEEILNDFIPLPHISLIRDDGIMPWTCKEFNIGYSPYHKRIIFPERHSFGDRDSYVGIIGRTVIPEYELLDIPKYLPVGKPFDKGYNLYGLQENYQPIQDVGFIVLAESQKSVLRRHSRLDKTVVSLGNHVVTEVQRQIIISLDVDVIICLDKDIDIHQIRQECEKFYNIRNVYYMFDKWGLLGEKDSPCDLEDKLYKFMFEYKVKYDAKEHQEYLKYNETR